MTYLQTALTLRLRTARTWLVLAAIICAACGLGLLVPEAPTALVEVGVALPEEGGAPFWEGLTARENALVRFLPADEATIEKKVAASNWDCGLVLPEDFSTRLNAGEFDGLVVLVTGPGSTVYPLVQETAAAVLLELAAPILAEDYLEEQGLGSDTLQPRPPDRQVTVTLVTPDGKTMEAPQLQEQSLSRLVRGCLAIVLLVWTALTAVDLGRWQETSWYRRLCLCCDEAQLLTARLLTALLPAMAAGGAVLVVLGESGGALALVPYLAALCSWTLLLARPLRDILPAILPLVAAASLLLSPVVVDVGRLFPVLAPVTDWLPVTLYLLAGEGSWVAVGKLVGIAVLGAGGYCWQLRQKRSGEWGSKA